ncbi:hypothetical protein [Burkholderia vietnamiensis]|uniref:hypothetical protein n=1 Tax=Burkholderia vietnamiensis TaxID=60552 RepID=UPI0012DB18C1|nr:hypothetical protein [Burkholderia vietnamiensis]
MQLRITLSYAAQKWRGEGFFATVSVLPTENIEDYPRIVNVAVPVRDLRSAYSVEVPAIPCRVEVVLPDGVRLESELREVDAKAELATVVLAKRKRSNGPAIFARSAVQTNHQEVARRSSGLQATTDFRDFPPDIVGFTLDSLEPFRIGPIVERETRVSLPQLGFSSGFEIKVHDLSRNTAATSFNSPRDIVSFFGMGDDNNTFANPERIYEASRVRSTGLTTVAELETQRYFVAPDMRTTTLRRYGLLREERVTYVVPLPIEMENEDSPEIDIRITARHGNKTRWSGKFAIEARPKDKLLDSMLMLVQRGEMASARSVMDRATEMLYQKFSNPYLAALGAHVLLGSEGANGLTAWHSWVKNLAQFFPHIPDGSIVLAALMLRRARGLLLEFEHESDMEIVTRAKRACLDAVACGLPQYSASVRLLARISSVIAGFEQAEDGPYAEEQPSTRKLLDISQWLLSHVDPTQGLTVLRHAEHEREYA